MPIEPPPSRYRVVERGRRLVVIDTQAGRHPPVGDYADPVAATADAARLDLAPETAVPDSLASVPWGSAVAADSAPARSLAPEQPDLLRIVAATVCSDVRDDAGRLVLTTARFYDSKGPRPIALDRDGERTVGGATLAALAGVVIAILIAVSIDWIWAVVLIAVAAQMTRQAKTIATPWLDRLAARSLRRS